MREQRGKLKLLLNLQTYRQGSLELKLIPEEEKCPAGTDISWEYNEAVSSSLGKTANRTELLWEETTAAAAPPYKDCRSTGSPQKSSINKQEGAIFSLLSRLPVFSGAP